MTKIYPRVPRPAGNRADSHRSLPDPPSCEGSNINGDIPHLLAKGDTPDTQMRPRIEVRQRYPFLASLQIATALNSTVKPSSAPMAICVETNQGLLIPTACIASWFT